jgi:hypothetical protein
MSDVEPQTDSLSQETRAANRSANIGCLLVFLAVFILVFSFGLGSYSAYRLHQYREELILQHLEKTLISKIEFNNLPPAQAMQKLKDRVMETDPWFKGVQFKVYNEKDLKDPTRPISSGLQKPITLEMKSVPARVVLDFYQKWTDGTIEVIDGSVNLLPKDETLEPRKLLSFRQVEADFWQTDPRVNADSLAEFWDVQPLVVAEGLPFLPRTYARYYPAQKRLEISNLILNNEKITTWLKFKKIIPSP